METEPQGLKQKKKISALNRLILIALSVALISLILIFIFPPQTEETEVDNVNLDEIGFDIKTSEAGNYTAMGVDHVLWVDGSGIAVLNVAGAEVLRIDVIMADPIVVQNGDYTLVAEFDGYKYCVLTTAGAVYQGKTEDPIKSAAVGPRGHAALVLDKIETKGVLRVLDPKGASLFDWFSLDKVQSGFILGAAFSSDNSRLMVSLLNTDSDLSFPIINFFSLYQQNLGEKLVTLTPKGFGAITYMEALGPQRMLFASSTSLGVLEGEGLQGRIEFSRIKSVVTVDDKIIVLAAVLENDPLKLYSWNGKSDTVQALDAQVFGEASLNLPGNKSYFAIADKQTVYIYSAASLKLIRTLGLPDNLIGGSINDEASVLYMTRYEIKRMRY